MAVNKPDKYSVCLRRAFFTCLVSLVIDDVPSALVNGAYIAIRIFVLLEKNNVSAGKLFASAVKYLSILDGLIVI